VNPIAGRRLFLCADPALVRAQLAGRDLARADAGALRDDISTDEICGACANCGPGASTSTGQVTVSAINRNFPGRSGPGQVWLASPATVAASAIAGTLASFDELMAAGAGVRN
jgi:homoaconitase/3-isopropylmalate dehydratase large subunit